MRRLFIQPCDLFSCLSFHDKFFDKSQSDIKSRIVTELNTKPDTFFPLYKKYYQEGMHPYDYKDYIASLERNPVGYKFLLRACAKVFGCTFTVYINNLTNPELIQGEAEEPIYLYYNGFVFDLLEPETKSTPTPHDAKIIFSGLSGVEEPPYYFEQTSYDENSVVLIVTCFPRPLQLLEEIDLIDQWKTRMHIGNLFIILNKVDLLDQDYSMVDALRVVYNRVFELFDYQLHIVEVSENDTSALRQLIESLPYRRAKQSIKDRVESARILIANIDQLAEKSSWECEIMQMNFFPETHWSTVQAILNRQGIFMNKNIPADIVKIFREIILQSTTKIDKSQLSTDIKAILSEMEQEIVDQVKSSCKKSLETCSEGTGVVYRIKRTLASFWIDVIYNSLRSLKIKLEKLAGRQANKIEKSLNMIDTFTKLFTEKYSFAHYIKHLYEKENISVKESEEVIEKQLLRVIPKDLYRQVSELLQLAFFSVQLLVDKQPIATKSNSNGTEYYATTVIKEGSQITVKLDYNMRGF